MIEGVLEALQKRQYFKLICGASFQDAEAVYALSKTYAQAGACMIDLACDPQVVASARKARQDLGSRVALMISISIDEDPHFRKIELEASGCILCQACLPVCPSEVFSITDTLVLDTPRCYGCNRCVPVCPTQVLTLRSISEFPNLQTLLAEVDAIEIHSAYADPSSIERLYADLGGQLQQKLVSICFRPQQFEREKTLDFLAACRQLTAFPLVIQVDGEPMSGSDDPEASLPAIRAALDLAPFIADTDFLTISGGINQYTAKLIQPYPELKGVAMGTMARKHVQPALSQHDQSGAVLLARELIQTFHRNRD
jgi:ferredoxin